MHVMLEPIGRFLANYLSKPLAKKSHITTNTPDLLAGSLRKGDVLLVDGNSRISEVIKYLTQSNWSHAALYVGEEYDPDQSHNPKHVLIEADVVDGVRMVPLSLYDSYHTRICRPVGLTEEELNQVISHTMSRLGQQYDHKNILDLMRYVIRTPVPSRWRRQMLAIGSGDPTRAICSSMIAEAFQTVMYPILPQVVIESTPGPSNIACYKEVLHIRHHSLYAPRDFDVSPYFEIVKPTIENGFDPHGLKWSKESTQ